MRTAALGSVATIDRTGVARGSIAPETLYLGLEHIERGGRIVGRDTVGRAELASTKFTFSKEHVLFGKLRPNLGKISRPDFAGVCSTDILPIRPGADLDRDYLAHYLSQPSMVDFAAARATGANLPRLSPTVLATFPIPLPPLAEQRRIAAILDHADALRAKRRQSLAHLDSLTQSIFQDMFADSACSSTVDAEATFIRTGPFGSQLLHGEFTEQGVAAVLGLDNVVSNEFRWVQRRFVTAEKYQSLKRYTVQPGDVLISIMGTTGRCVVAPEDLPLAINTKHICAITMSDRVLPAFLRASFLWHPDSLGHLRRQTKGSIMDGLNMGIIKSMPIPVPPPSKQRLFADRVDQASMQAAAVSRAVTADDELFASLQARAFRGEL